MEELHRLLGKFVHSSDMSARFPLGIVHPRRDWFVLLIAAVLIALALLGFSAVLFMRASQEPASLTTGHEVTPATINREQLLDVVQQFEEKEGMLEALRNAKPSVGQP